MRWKRLLSRRRIGAAVLAALVLGGVDYVATQPTRGISDTAVARDTAAAAASLAVVPAHPGLAPNAAVPLVAWTGTGPARAPRTGPGQPGPPAVPAGAPFGLSIELGWWCQHGLALAHGNFASFLASIGPSLLRVGGRTIDTISYQPRGPQGSPNVLTDAELRALFATARRGDARVIFTLPVRASARDLALEARAVAREGGTSLAGFAIGNEPDLMNHAARQGFTSYAQVWRGQASVVIASAPGVALVGPDLARAGSRVERRWLEAILAAAPHSPAAITLHFYATNLRHPAPGVPPTLAGLLGPTLRARETTELTAAVRSAPPGVPVWLDETNSAVGGGIPGVSNTRGAALWAVDFLLRARSVGVAAVDLHVASGPGCQQYSPLCLPSNRDAAAGTLRPEPLWEAIKLVDSLAPAEVTPLSGLGDLNGWSLSGREGSSAVLVNTSPVTRQIRVRGIPSAGSCRLTVLLATDPTSALAPVTTVRRCPTTATATATATATGKSLSARGGTTVWRLTIPPDAVLAVSD